MRKIVKTHWLVFLPILLLFIVLAGCGGDQDVPLKPGELFRNDFARLDSSKWWVVKGSPHTQDGWLVLASTPKHGTEVQSLQPFKYESLEFKSSSANWAIDTSIGFEMWSGRVHRAIVVTNGHLGIINQGKSQKPNEWYGSIPEWNSIGNQVNVFNIIWNLKKVELLINGKSAVVYRGDLIPDTNMNIRINSSNDYSDEIKVDYVSVMQ